jgi:choline/ethanolamine kinase
MRTAHCLICGEFKACLLLSVCCSGGLSNWIYLCKLPSDRIPKNGEPAQVLLRFYGQVHGEKVLEGLITESVIFTLLSERRLGPKLHGVFPGGRLEEFIQARVLLHCLCEQV